MLDISFLVFLLSTYNQVFFTKILRLFFCLANSFFQQFVNVLNLWDRYRSQPNTHGDD